MLNDLRVQYSILDKHLSKPGQDFIGLKNRPTIADIAVYPFADDPTMARMGLDKNDFPALKEWSMRFSQLPGVMKAYAEMDSREEDVIEDWYFNRDLGVIHIRKYTWAWYIPVLSLSSPLLSLFHLLELDDRHPTYKTDIYLPYFSQ